MPLPGNFEYSDILDEKLSENEQKIKNLEKNIDLMFLYLIWLKKIFCKKRKSRRNFRNNVIFSEY